MGLRQEKQKVLEDECLMWRQDPRCTGTVLDPPTRLSNCHGVVLNQLPHPLQCLSYPFTIIWGHPPDFRARFPGPKFAPIPTTCIYIYKYINMTFPGPPKQISWSYSHTIKYYDIIPSFQLNFYCLCNNIALN